MLQLCDRLEVLESAATFVKLTPPQPKIAASRGLDPIAARRENADALSAAALHAALHPSDHRASGNSCARRRRGARSRNASRSQPAVGNSWRFAPARHLRSDPPVTRSCATIRSRLISASSSSISGLSYANISSRLRTTARPSRATSAPSSISAPSNSSTRAPLAPITTFIAIIMSGCIIRSSRRSRRRSSSAPRSAGPNARSPTRHRCSTSRP
jgi:hypothetical protein